MMMVIAMMIVTMMQMQMIDGQVVDDDGDIPGVRQGGCITADC
jgi:hypothetical protein